MSALKNDDDGMQYNVDVNAVAKDVFGLEKNRNDLAVQIENGTAYGFALEFRVDHGALSSTKGDVTLRPAVDTVPSSYTVGVKAKGAGSNIVFLFKFAKPANFKPIHLMAAAPPNKTNYVKCNTDAPPTAGLGKGFDKCQKQYANNGPTYEDLHTTDSKVSELAHVEMLITNVSPAVCMFRVKSGPRP
jgi:hypothetical protein